MGIEERMLSRAGSRGRARVVYTDLDGTMLGVGGSFFRGPDGAPTDEPARALLEAQRAGVEVVPVSGRALRGLVGDGRILGCPTVIAEMGAMIAYDYGREVITHFGEAPLGDEEMPVQAMERTGAVGLLFECYPGRLEYHLPWSAWRECSALLRGLVDPDEAAAALGRAGHGWLELVDNGALRGAYLGMPPGAAHVYHLVPRGVSKGTGVAADRERRGIAREECIAVGDAIGDLVVAPHVGTLVLVRDAVEGDPELARRALEHENVLVADRAMNLGWADAVRALALG